MSQFDQRIVRVSIEINGQLKVYQDLQIEASGTKYANEIQDECEIKITNIDKETMNYILTETSPFNKNKTPKSIKVEAGRESYGVTTIYEGDIITAVPSQPPDIQLTLKSLTKNFQKGNIVNSTQPGISPLSVIAKNVADNMGTSLDFQATDKNINNYTFVGCSIKQVEKLNRMSLINAYVDGNVLFVKDLNKPLQNVEAIVNINTGMIGIPEITEQGIKVKMLLDGRLKVGGLMKVNSIIYPQVDGEYVIYKLGFQISNRDVPFYWIAEGKVSG
jgi:hypothetical protein